MSPLRLVTAPRFVNGVITAITLIPVRLTAFTDQSGFRAAYSSAPARGTTGVGAGAGVAMDIGADMDSVAATAIAADTAASMPIPDTVADTAVERRLVALAAAEPVVGLPEAVTQAASAAAATWAAAVDSMAAAVVTGNRFC